MNDSSKPTSISAYAVLSELLSTIYNLSALAKRADYIKPADLTLSDNIKKWLTILEYSETLLELATLSLPKGRKNVENSANKLKWIIVSLVQLAKCAGRMVLLLKCKEGLLPHPPLQVKREHIASLNVHQPRPYSYALKSGRRIRSIRPVYIQSNRDIEDTSNNETVNELSGMELIAEAAYIVKPIAHLGALYLAGRRSWKPWMLSLAVDLASLVVLHNALARKELSYIQKKEVVQRQIALVTYLLRSPFYDRNTKRLLEAALYSLEMFIPCTSRLLVRPLLAHLPLFQQIYFYVWSH